MLQLVQENYTTQFLANLRDQGKAKNYRVEGRTDINHFDVVKDVPVLVFILVDEKDGTPWSWNFTFNLSAAKCNGRNVDVEKIKNLAERFSLPDRKIGVELFNPPRHSRWPSSNLLQVAALNLPPANITGFLQAVFDEAIS